jgi:uncharacterized protein with PIN domain
MTSLLIVDEDTAARTIRALADARTRCISPVVALNQAGLLLTDHLACHIRADVLTSAADTIRATRVRTLVEERLLPKDPTPAVVIKAVADRIEWLAGRAKEGGFR